MTTSNNGLPGYILEALAKLKLTSTHFRILNIIGAKTTILDTSDWRSEPAFISSGDIALSTGIDESLIRKSLRELTIKNIIIRQFSTNTEANQYGNQHTKPLLHLNLSADKWDWGGQIHPTKQGLGGSNRADQTPAGGSSTPDQTSGMRDSAQGGLTPGGQIHPTKQGLGGSNRADQTPAGGSSTPDQTSGMRDSAQGGLTPGGHIHPTKQGLGGSNRADQTPAGGAITPDQINNNKLPYNIVRPSSDIENITLTRAQFDKLVGRFGVEGTDGRVEELSLYMTTKGVDYKDHYSEILVFERNKQKQQGNKTENTGGANKYTSGKYGSRVER